MNRPEVCVSAVVRRGDALLVVQRGHGPGVGRWAVPGGRVEPGETLAAAVEREVAEETGLTVRCGRLIGAVERLDADDHFVILAHAAELVADGASATPRAGDDAAVARWVPIEALASLDLVPGLLDFLEALMRQRGVTCVFASASANAEGFYSQRGYELIGARTPEHGQPIRKQLVPALSQEEVHPHRGGS